MATNFAVFFFTSAAARARALLVAMVLAAAAMPAGAQAASHVPSWELHLRMVSERLSAGDARGATRAWHDADVEARRTGRWEPMLAVGDAAMAIATAMGPRSSYVAHARAAYMSAFFRAYAQGSSEGAVNAGEAFYEVGDYDVAVTCLNAASRMSAVSVVERHRIRDLTGKLAKLTRRPKTSARSHRMEWRAVPNSRTRVRAKPVRAARVR